MKSGFVSLIGRPNVGKSTLLNSILGKKVAITSEKPQTTRNMIQGIYNDKDTQIVFVDTPGIHKPQDKLGRELNKEAYSNLSDIDLILFIVDASSGIGKGDKFIINALKNNDVPVILILNKIDKLNNEGINVLLNVLNKFNKIYITESPKRHFLCEKCKPRLEIGNLPPPIFANWQCQKRKPPPREMLRIRLAACVRPRWGRMYFPDLG